MDAIYTIKYTLAVRKRGILKSEFLRLYRFWVVLNISVI